MGLFDDWIGRKFDRHYQGAPRNVGDATPNNSATPVDPYGNPDPNGQPPGFDYDTRPPPARPVTLRDALLGEVVRQRPDPYADERPDPRRRPQRNDIWERMDDRWRRGQSNGPTCYAVGCNCHNNFWRGRG